MSDAASAIKQRRLQAQIAAHMAVSGLDHDTNGNTQGRFWNFFVNLSAVEDRPAVQVPVTFHCAKGVVGALVAMKVIGAFDEVALEAYRTLSHYTAVRLFELPGDDPRVIVRADVAWFESISTVLPFEVFTALWHSAVSAWITLDVQFPGRFELVEVDGVPESRLMLLTPLGQDSTAPEPAAST